MSPVGRLCFKSLFAPLIANFSSYRRGFRVNMWETSSPGDKLTGDFGNRSDATSINDRGLFRLLAGNLSPGVCSAVASPRSGSRGPQLLAGGAGISDLAQRPVETRLLLVVERIVELLQHRAHGHDRKQHDVEAIRCSGEPTHGTQERIGGAGTGDKLCHGG